MTQATGTVGAPVRRADLPRIRSNRWQDLEVPRLGTWTPRLEVSVVVPCYQAADELRLTLAALGCQTYPSELMQVVVVDDGSEVPVSVEGIDLPCDVKVVRQDHEGFGAGRARQAGAVAADGDVVLFLDADIVVDPSHVEAHARWHHLVEDAATMGFRTFVDFSGITADQVAAAADDGGIDALLAGRHQQPHDWIEAYLARTDDLREQGGDEWRIVVGASLGVGKRLLDQMGGLPTFGVRGTEDTTLGYRLFTLGALLVPDREARSWHQGARTLDDPEVKQRIFRAREPLMANEIPDPRFRTPEPGRSYRVPAVVVTVPVDAHTDEDEAVRAVTAVLGSELHDLVVGVAGPEDAPARRRAEAWFSGDPRVTVTDAADWHAAHPFSPVRATVPPHAVVGPATLHRALATMDDGRLGALHVTVPGSSPSHGIMHLVRTRALRRAERLARDGEEVGPIVGELFGERWVGGEEYDIDRRPRSDDEESETIRDGRYAGWRAQELVARLQETERKLHRLQRRRVVLVINAVAKLRGVRSPRALLSGFVGVARAALRGRASP